MVDSKGNVLVQMADMIAGSINRAQGSKPDAKKYIGLIKKHIDDIWYFK